MCKLFSIIRNIYFSLAYIAVYCRVYPFKKDPKILQFLDNFSDHNSSDDEMWERSKEIKPSGNRWLDNRWTGNRWSGNPDRVTADRVIAERVIADRVNLIYTR